MKEIAEEVLYRVPGRCAICGDDGGMRREETAMPAPIVTSLVMVTVVCTACGARFPRGAGAPVDAAVATC